MATRVLRSIDDLAHGQWQLLLAPLSTAQTILTVAQVVQNMDANASFTEAIEVLDVHSLAAIEIAAWSAVAANDTTAVVELYGWPKQGPGRHLGTLGLTCGNFTSAASTGWHTIAGNAHASVRGSFLNATAYRGYDTYTETADIFGNIVALGTPEANFPCHATLSFLNDGLDFISAVPTTIPATASSTFGMVWRTVALKEPKNSGYL